jgi:hypothetical protein
MGNNKDPNKIRPGEMEPGTFHFNPGNMSGKKAEGRKDRSGTRSQDPKAGREQTEPGPKGVGNKDDGGS